MRLGVTLSCTSTTPGYGWWASYGLTTTAAPFDLKTVYGLMEQAYIDHLIPIVTLRQDDNCPSFLLPSAWASEVKDFINGFYIEASDMPLPLPMTYFEITNEVNDDPQYGYGGNYYGNSQYTFQDFFSAAAQSLRGALDAYNGNTTSPYRILTGGMLAPTASGNFSSCPDMNCAGQPTGYENVDLANNALTEAEKSPNNVPTSRLGVAIHPYDYNTNETQTYWQNYYNDYGYSQQSKNGPAGVCGDLGAMLNLWTNTYFPALPVIATEDNWLSDPQNHLPSCTGGGCHITCSNAAGCSGTYLVDLLTWLSDHNYDCMTVDNSIGCSSASTFRLSWFRGMDVPTDTFSSNPIDPLGIYGVNGPPAALAEKNFTTTYCPNDNNVMGAHSIANAYWELGSCY